MDLRDIVAPDRVFLNLRVRDKGALLEELALRVGAPGLAPGEIAAALKQREELGSTGLGRGFALPHARLPELRTFRGVFARLARPIDYAAVDGDPIDLVFLLLIPQQEGADPENASVATLAAIARLFRNEDILAKVRKAATIEEVHGLLAGG